MEDDRYNPLLKEEQEEILLDAVNVAMKKGRPGTKDFVKELATALAYELDRRCVDKRLYNRKGSRASVS